MDRDRRMEALRTGRLTKEEVSEGWHFCPEWDYDLLHKDDPEAELCRCKRKEHDNPGTSQQS